MKKIAITDESFVSKAFAAQYKGKYEFCDASGVDWTRADKANAFFRDNAADAVVYVALPYATQDDGDLIRFKNIQYAATLYGVKKMLTVSDASDLDLSQPLVGASESALGMREPSCRGVGRMIANRLATRDKIGTVLRTFAVYGAGMPATDPLTAILSHAVVGGKQIDLAADKTISAVYIDDLCKIMAAFIENDYERGIYNVASPTPTSYAEFAKKAKSYAKKNDRDISVSVGKATECECTADVTKLLAVLGAFRFTAAATGITKTLDYFAKHKSELKIS